MFISVWYSVCFIGKIYIFCVIKSFGRDGVKLDFWCCWKHGELKCRCFLKIDKISKYLCRKYWSQTIIKKTKKKTGASGPHLWSHPSSLCSSVGEQLAKIKVKFKRGQCKPKSITLLIYQSLFSGENSEGYQELGNQTDIF